MVLWAKKQQQCLPGELEVGDCWIALSLANSRGLILAARVGKHPDGLIEQLSVNPAGKTDCQRWNSDDWGGYERVLPLTSCTTSAKTGHSDRSCAPMVFSGNKLANGIDDRTSLASCESTPLVTTRLVVTYCNWIWQHSRFKTTAAQPAGLTERCWCWHDIAIYPTII